MFDGGVWAGVDAAESEVLGNELAESANDLDPSMFAFSKDLGYLHNECGVDSAREDFDGAWRDLKLLAQC